MNSIRNFVIQGRGKNISMNNGSTNEKSLNALRGIGACVIAFVWHYQHFGPQDGSPFYSLWPLFYQYGYAFVGLFFMLSGFGMVRGYEISISENNISFTEYLKRRFKRLFPLLWVTLGVITVLQFIYKFKMGTTFVYSGFDFYYFVLNVLGMQNGIFGTAYSFNGPAWCISVCIFCYILFYIVVKCSIKLGNDRSCLYLGIGICGCALWVSGMYAPIFNGQIAQGVSCFFIGAFLAKITQVCKAKLGYISIVCVLASWLLLRVFGIEIIGENIVLMTTVWFAPLTVLAVLYVPWLRSFFEWRAFQYFGKISIDIYLWHFPIQCLIKIIDIYFNLHINYSCKETWILYALCVLFVSAVYEKYAAPKLARAFDFLSS